MMCSLAMSVFFTNHLRSEFREICLLQCYLIASCRKGMAKWLHLLNSKIQLVILPTDYHTFLYKSDKKIWYYIRITPTS